MALDTIPQLRLERLRPGDERTVLALLDALSPRSRRLRFLSPAPRVSPSLVRQLADVGPAHLALVARLGPAVIGEARYVRSAREPDTADVSVAVADEHQRRGVATTLLAALAREAARAGIRAFTFDVSPENRAMLRLLAGVGAQTWFEAGLISGRVPLEAFAPPASPRAA